MPNMRHHKGAAFSLGKSQRSDMAGSKENKLKPGPGNYDQTADMRRTAPRYGFGTERRP